jgi:hypothetical protein
MTENQPPTDINGTPATLPSRRRRGASAWRGDWQIAVVIAVLVVGGGVALWILRSSHHTPHKIVLPATLLGQSPYTGPNAASEKTNLESQAYVDAGGSSTPLAGLYGNLPGGPAVAVVVQTPCGGGNCVLPTSSQIVQSMKRSGDPEVRVFSLSGGLMVCNTFRDSGQIHCGWIDQVTNGNVFFASGFASSLAEAAAKTTRIVGSIES